MILQSHMVNHCRECGKPLERYLIEKYSIDTGKQLWVRACPEEGHDVWEQQAHDAEWYESR